MYRYYLPQRPPMPGTIPNGAVVAEDFGERKSVPQVARPVWGYADYKEPLTMAQIDDYELLEQGPFYQRKETGEIVSYQEMLRQFRECYDGEDTTSPISWDEYFEEVQ